MFFKIEEEMQKNPLYYADEINRINLRAVSLMPLIGIPASVFNILAHMIMTRQTYAQQSGIILLVYYCAVLIISRAASLVSYTGGTTLIYLVQAPVYLITILSGTVLDPDYQAITFLLFIIALPPFVLDRPGKAIGVMSLWSLLFIGLSWYCKEEPVFRADFLHIMQAYSLSLGAQIIILDSRFKMIRNHLEMIRYSETDELTGLLNRRFFLMNVSKLIMARKASFIGPEICEVGERDGIPASEAAGEAGRHKVRPVNPSPLVIAAFDISQMRSYNEQNGYHEGNQLLIEVGKRLSEEFPGCLTARFEEDHYYVFAHQNMVELAIDHLREHPVLGVSGHPIVMTIGMYRIAENDSVTVACDRAALAQQRATKAQPVRVYDEKLRTEHELTQHLLNRFHEAMAAGEFEVYYQPIVDSRTGEIVCAEALVRWRNPERGLISPAVIIPLLEDNGFITELDLYVVRRVAEEMLVGDRIGFPKNPVSVNLSRMDFTAKDMPQEITAILDSMNIPHNRIMIEVTESAFAIANARIRESLIRFHRLGFKVWMDDFGSGYSSLNLLREFNFDTVKFDMQFVRNLADEEKSRTILKHLIELVEALGIVTLVEGIETEEQKEMISEMGARLMQGYIFGRPIPFDEVREKYRKEESE